MNDAVAEPDSARCVAAPCFPSCRPEAAQRVRNRSVISAENSVAQAPLGLSRWNALAIWPEPKEYAPAADRRLAAVCGHTRRRSLRARACALFACPSGHFGRLAAPFAARPLLGCVYAPAHTCQAADCACVFVWMYAPGHTWYVRAHTRDSAPMAGEPRALDAISTRQSGLSSIRNRRRTALHRPLSAPLPSALHRSSARCRSAFCPVTEAFAPPGWLAGSSVGRYPGNISAPGLPGQLSPSAPSSARLAVPERSEPVPRALRRGHS